MSGTRKKKAPAAQPALQPKAASFDPLTDCAKEYGSLIAYPYVRQHKACVPTIPAFPSRKMSVYASGVAKVNTDGMAWGVLNAGHGILNATNHVLYCSRSTTGGTTIDLSVSKSLQVFSNSDYATMDGIQYRIVAAGIRCCYSGQIKDTGGTISLVETSDHETIAGLTREDISAYDESATFIVQPGDWYSVEWHPADPTELNYSNTATGTASSACLGFAFEGLAGQEFLVEAYCHYEVVGKVARSKTRSHADPSGMAASMAVNGSPGGRRPSKSSNRTSGASGVIAKIGSRLAAMAEYSLKGISGAAKALLPALPTAKHFYKHATAFVRANAGQALAGMAVKAAPLMLAMAA